VDRLDDVRLSEAKQIVQALEVRAPALEPFAAITLLVELMLLHHGAHRPVKDDDAFAQQLRQLNRPAVQ